MDRDSGKYTLFKHWITKDHKLIEMYMLNWVYLCGKFSSRGRWGHAGVFRSYFSPGLVFSCVMNGLFLVPIKVTGYIRYSPGCNLTGFFFNANDWNLIYTGFYQYLQLFPLCLLQCVWEFEPLTIHLSRLKSHFKKNTKKYNYYLMNMCEYWFFKIASLKFSFS